MPGAPWHHCVRISDRAAHRQPSPAIGSQLARPSSTTAVAVTVRRRRARALASALRPEQVGPLRRARRRTPPSRGPGRRTGPPGRTGAGSRSGSRAARPAPTRPRPRRRAACHTAAQRGSPVRSSSAAATSIEPGAPHITSTAGSRRSLEHVVEQVAAGGVRRQPLGDRQDAGAAEPEAGRRRARGRARQVALVQAVGDGGEVARRAELGQRPDDTGGAKVDPGERSPHVLVAVLVERVQRPQRRVVESPLRIVDDRRDRGPSPGARPTADPSAARVAQASEGPRRHFTEDAFVSTPSGSGMAETMTEPRKPPEDQPAKADEKGPGAGRRPARPRPTDPEKARTVHGDEEAVV